MIDKYLKFFESKNGKLSGKYLFKCYLKIFTALGLKKLNIDWKLVPDKYLIYYQSDNINIERLKMIMSRYKQFSKFINSTDYIHNDCKIYYGIGCDMNLHYGIKTETQKIEIGEFPITDGSLRWIITLDSPSSLSLKKQLIGLSVNKMRTLCLVKSNFKFRPDNIDHISPVLFEHDTITFSYKITPNGVVDVDALKSKLREYLSKTPFSKMIKFGVVVNSDSIFLNIKAK